MNWGFWNLQILCDSLLQYCKTVPICNDTVKLNFLDAWEIFLALLERNLSLHVFTLLFSLPQRLLFPSARLLFAFAIASWNGGFWFLNFAELLFHFCSSALVYQLQKAYPCKQSWNFLYPRISNTNIRKLQEINCKQVGKRFLSPRILNTKNQLQEIYDFFFPFTWFRRTKSDCKKLGKSFCHRISKHIPSNTETAENPLNFPWLKMEWVIQKLDHPIQIPTKLKKSSKQFLMQTWKFNHHFP